MANPIASEVRTMEEKEKIIKPKIVVPRVTDV